MRKYTKLFLILLSVCILMLSGCTMFNEKNDENIMNEKIETEMQFIEDNIFNITNKYAKEEYVKDDKLNWKEILSDIKEINTTLDTIVSDLSKSNINNDDIISLSARLNDLLIVATSENELDLLPKLNDLYLVIPKIYNQFSDDKNSMQEKELKSMVLSTYAFANLDKWDDAKTTIQSTIDKFNGMMNDVEYMQSRSYKLNRSYVLLGEMKNAIDIENIGLVKIKFVNLIEKI